MPFSCHCESASGGRSNLEGFIRDEEHLSQQSTIDSLDACTAFLAPILLVNLVIHLFKELMSNYFLKLLLVQVFGGNLLVLFHAIYEKTLKSLQKDIAKVLHGIGQGCLAQRRIGHGIFADGIEEQLVPWLEIGTKTLIENVDQLGELDLLSVTDTCANFGWSGDLPPFPDCRSIDPSLIF